MEQGGFVKMRRSEKWRSKTHYCENCGQKIVFFLRKKRSYRNIGSNISGHTLCRKCNKATIDSLVLNDRKWDRIKHEMLMSGSERQQSESEFDLALLSDDS